MSKEERGSEDYALRCMVLRVSSLHWRQKGNSSDRFSSDHLLLHKRKRKGEEEVGLDLLFSMYSIEVLSCVLIHGSAFF